MLVLSSLTHDFHMLTGSVRCAYQMTVLVLCCTELLRMLWRWRWKWAQAECAINLSDGCVDFSFLQLQHPLRTLSFRASIWENWAHVHETTALPTSSSLAIIETQGTEPAPYPVLPCPLQQSGPVSVIAHITDYYWLSQVLSFVVRLSSGFQHLSHFHQIHLQNGP